MSNIVHSHTLLCHEGPGHLFFCFIITTYIISSHQPPFITDLTILLYPLHYLHHHSFSYTPLHHTPFVSFHFQTCCVRAHTETHFVHIRFFREGHLWLCYLWYQPPRTQ